MSHVVAVAGGTGGLGRAIVEALKAQGGYEVVILGRKTNPQVEEATGARLIAADYSDPDGLVALLEKNKIWAIISTMNSGMDTTPEMNLIQAAEKSKVTRRYIPNMWSAIVYRPEHLALFPFVGPRLQVQDMLKKSNLEFTTIYPGIFMDYYIQGLPTHLTQMPIAVDVYANVAGIPGSGNSPITFTHSTDIGKFVSRLMSLQSWESRYHTVGDNKTWNEVVAILEEGKGVKFDVTYDSIEKLQKGEITDIPGHQAAYEMMGGEAAKPFFRNAMAQFGLWMEEGLFKYEDAVFLNDVFPNVKPMSLGEAWKKAAAK